MKASTAAPKKPEPKKVPAKKAKKAAKEESGLGLLGNWRELGEQQQKEAIASEKAWAETEAGFWDGVVQRVGLLRRGLQSRGVALRRGGRGLKCGDTSPLRGIDALYFGRRGVFGGDGVDAVHDARQFFQGVSSSILK